MSIERKGEMLKPRPKKGELLKPKVQEGELLKSEGQKGNPLWKDTKLNEEKKKLKRINE